MSGGKEGAEEAPHLLNSLHRRVPPLLAALPFGSFPFKNTRAVLIAVGSFEFLFGCRVGSIGDWDRIFCEIRKIKTEI